MLPPHKYRRGFVLARKREALARHKAAQNCQILPWLSQKANCKEPKFLQIGVSLFESDAFQALTPAQRYLYLCMCQDAGGHQVFEFPRARFTHYGISNTAARAGIERLIAEGFIEREFCGKFTREKSKYRFSLRWKLEGAKINT